MNPVRHSPPKIQSNQKLGLVLYYGSDTAINEMDKDRAESNTTNVKKRQKRSLTQFSQLELSPQLNSDIKVLFDELKCQQEQKFESLNSAISVVINQNQEIKTSVEFMSNQYDELFKKIAYLEHENVSYKKKVESLEAKIEMLEKNAHNSTVEIRNIPLQEKEDRLTTTRIVKDIGEAIGLPSPIQDSEIRDIYRTKAETIVVDFSTTQRKEALITTLKNLNKSKRNNKEPVLNTQSINIPGPNKIIYISDYLTHKAKRLFYLAREEVKCKKLFAAWTSFGKIYIKFAEDGKPIRIENEADLGIAKK
ncbi:unnamed protein product [Chilo suppressalis]|uniref:Zinc finger DNA binding protein n=1 Tax=Chilo suppressalis TaxID=168631 RepID=A0ABN8B6Q2_CHISP|nr:unnamed protein product [Chilo suppressalis]